MPHVKMLPKKAHLKIRHKTSVQESFRNVSVLGINRVAVAHQSPGLRLALPGDTISEHTIQPRSGCTKKSNPYRVDIGVSPFESPRMNTGL